MLRVNNKNIIMTLLMSFFVFVVNFEHISSVSVVEFGQINVRWAISEISL